MKAALFFLVAGTNPIAKVLQLLGDLQQKVLKEGEAEQKQYEAFAEWCEDSAVEKQHSIKTGKATVERLQACIEKESASIDGFASKIEDLAGTIATNEADLKAATEIRDKEAADFDKADADLGQTVDMLSRAIGIISSEMRGSSLLQGKAGTTSQKEFKDLMQILVTNSGVNSYDRSRLQAVLGTDAFLQQPAGAPDPAAYASHSSGILNVLEDMKEKAAALRHDGQKAEMTSKHNFEMLAQSLSDAIKFDQKELGAAKAGKATSEEAKFEAAGSLSSAQSGLADDEKDLADLSTDCQQRASDWSLSQKSRGDELQALVDAKNIIEEKTGAGSAAAYGLLQQDAETDSTDDAKAELVAKLASLQQASKDVVLAQLANRVSAALQGSGDVFGKVKGLIQDMIEKLVADAAAEASHKAFCDKEMSTSEAKIDDHTATIEKFTARKDKATAAIAKQEGEIGQLRAELAAIAKQQVTMDGLRAEEKAAFAVSKKDYEDGIEGLTMALQILRDYYADDKEALLQQPAVSNHAKAGGAATGIIGLLEVAQSDFSRLLAEATVTEDASASEYAKISQDNKVATAMKTTSVEGKTKSIASLKQQVSDLSSDIDGEQNELDAVSEYYDKLKPQCVAKPEPYAERKRRREAEINGLKEAMSILAGLDGGEAFLAVRRAVVRKHA